MVEVLPFKTHRGNWDSHATCLPFSLSVFYPGVSVRMVRVNNSVSACERRALLCCLLSAWLCRDTRFLNALLNSYIRMAYTRGFKMELAKYITTSISWIPTLDWLLPLKYPTQYTLITTWFLMLRISLAFERTKAVWIIKWIQKEQLPSCVIFHSFIVFISTCSAY